MKKYLVLLFIPCIFIFFVISLAACARRSVNTDTTGVTDSVTAMMANIANGVSKGGPVAWLNYFENSPDFFMVSSGQLVFHNYREAEKTIQDTLVKNITKITLRWSNVRVDPFTNTLATVTAGFHEDMVMGGKTASFDGYFTGTAHYIQNQWKLKNAHWSMKGH